MFQTTKPVIYVDNQEEAVEFWITKIGLEVVVNNPMGITNWIEVAPKGIENFRLVLAAKTVLEQQRKVPYTGDIIFEVNDLESLYSSLKLKGVELSE
ncbi:VOC family protein [Mycoplasmatota bacterium WC44]